MGVSVFLNGYVRNVDRHRAQTGERDSELWSAREGVDLAFLAFAETALTLFGLAFSCGIREKMSAIIGVDLALSSYKKHRRNLRKFLQLWVGTVPWW